MHGVRLDEHCTKPRLTREICQKQQRARRRRASFLQISRVAPERRCLLVLIGFFPERITMSKHVSVVHWLPQVTAFLLCSVCAIAVGQFDLNSAILSLTTQPPRDVPASGEQIFTTRKKDALFEWNLFTQLSYYQAIRSQFKCAQNLPRHSAY